MIRAVVFALLGFIVAWIAATAYFLSDSIIQGRFAGVPDMRTVWRYALATHTYGYLGGTLGVAAAVSISRTRSLLSRIALWFLLGLVINSAVAVFLHDKHLGRLPTAGELYVLVGRLRMLLAPVVAASVVVPLLETVWESTYWKVRRIRKRASRDVGGNINFDAIAYSELEERANAYLHEKRRKAHDVPAHHRAEEESLLDLDHHPKR